MQRANRVCLQLFLLSALAALSMRAQSTSYTNTQVYSTPLTTGAGGGILLTVSSGSATQSGVLSGTGAIIQDRAVPLTLSPANPFTRLPPLSAGTPALT